MFPRVSAALWLRPRPRPRPRLPLCSGGPEASAAAIALLGAPHGPARTKNNTQRYFGTNNRTYSKKDEQSIPAQETPKETESEGGVKEKGKKGLLNIIKGMKVELSTVNVQTTKPPGRKALKRSEAATGRPQKAAGEDPKKRA
ncbi:mitochondrial ribosomal protein S31 [Phyllostomus discolor]|uniref:Mitochondrial ribosomal protein S31 n=1 Tax=Phyllostomus discolor TaxID=89673 RepID=A0A833Z5A9_9CHIR|nr:mitochondrial ribosomal protein S31 [Phyllostomus discolor]